MELEGGVEGLHVLVLVIQGLVLLLQATFLACLYTSAPWMLPMVHTESRKKVSLSLCPL